MKFVGRLFELMRRINSGKFSSQCVADIVGVGLRSNARRNVMSRGAVTVFAKRTGMFRW